MNNQSLVTKNWTLLRYAVEINLSNSNSVSSIERQQFVYVFNSDIYIQIFNLDHNVK